MGKILAFAVLLVACGGQPGSDGEPGERGATGPTGLPFAGTQFASSVFCVGELAGTALWFTYNAVVMKSGDVWATGSIRDGKSEVGATAFYAATQEGAGTAIVVFQFDVIGAVNSGYWTIQVNRSTRTTVITNYDADRSGAQESWLMTADKCQAHTY